MAEVSSLQPNKDRIVKFAIHDRGWLAPAPHLGLPSIPRTTLSVGFEQQQVPPAASRALREGLRRVYPRLAEKDFMETRLCWCALSLALPSRQKLTLSV